MDVLFLIAVLVSLCALWLVFKGVDVRLVLFSAACIIAAFAGNMLAIFDVFFHRMGDAQVVGPICSAMGYSFVLRWTGSDKEMVRFLLHPLRRVRWLLIPGGCVVGFVTNMAITSQTASAAALGPILLPLMRGAGFHPLIAAATLVLGCSGGGNLFNPGEPDVVNVQVNAHATTEQVLQHMLWPELLGFVVAVLLFWILSVRSFPMGAGDEDDTTHHAPISILKALLPPLPIVILFVLLPGFHLVPKVAEWYPSGLPVVHAMLASTIVAAVVVRKDISRLTKEFFEGLGFGYVHVISLIITASCFIEALKMSKLMDVLVRSISSGGVWSYLSSSLSTMAMAFVSGSGTAPSIAFSKAVLPGLLQQGMQQAQVLDLGCIADVGASFGRTMSPVAAIVIFAASVSQVPARDVVKRLVVPLLCGLVSAFLFLAL